MSQLGLFVDGKPLRRAPAPPSSMRDMDVHAPSTPPLVEPSRARQAPTNDADDPAAIAASICGELVGALDCMADIERDLTAGPAPAGAPENVERHAPVRLRRADAERLRARQITLRADVVRLPGCDAPGDGLDPLVPIALRRIEEACAPDLAMMCRRFRVAIEAGDAIALDLRPYARPLLAALHVLAIAGDVELPGVDRTAFLDLAHDDATAAERLLHETRCRLESPPTWDQELVSLLDRANARADEEIEEMRMAHAEILGCSVEELDARQAEEKRKEREAKARRRADRPARGQATTAPAPRGKQRVLDEEPAVAPTRRLNYRERELLAMVAVEGNRAVYLPRNVVPDWHALKGVVETLGGVWKKGGKKRRSGWDFAEDIDAAEVIRLAQERGEILDLRAAGLFETPVALAEELVRLAEIQTGAVVLEPSAGRGRVALAVRRLHPDARVVCVELLEPNVRELEKLGFVARSTWFGPDEDRGLVRLGFDGVQQADFLSVRPDDLPEIDCVVMNPPFAKFAEVEHVEHAMRCVRPGGHVAAIMSAAVRYRDAEPYRRLRALIEANDGHIVDLPEGAFLESGTGVRTVMVTMRRGGE